MKEKKKVVNELYCKLREDIVAGKFKPGEHLSEKLLTEQYKVSRASIREVIRQLGSQGFLTVEPHRGAVVTQLSWEDINVCYNIIIRCESYAASLFVEHGNAESIKKLQALHAKTKDIDISSQHNAWIKINDSFHELIYRNCGHEILSQLVHHTRLRINSFRFRLAASSTIDSYVDEHAQILQAMVCGDARETEKLMIKHLDNSRKNRFKVLGEFSGLFSDI